MARVNRDSSLFEVSAKVPDGFIYHQNFISEAEEHELIGEIQKLHLTVKEVRYAIMMRTLRAKP